MAKESNKNQVEQQQQEARPCPKDCTKCSFQQHAFCSAQMCFYLVEKVNSLQVQNEGLSKALEDIANKIDAMESEKQVKNLINPIQNITQ